MPFKKAYKKRAYKRPARKPAANKTMSFAKRVNQVIQRVAEKKYIQKVVQNQTLTSAIAGGTFDAKFQDMLPQLSQGVTDSTRIGNEVTITKNIFKGYVTMYTQNSITNPVPADTFIKMWIVSIKSFKPFYQSPAGATWSNFFQGNNVGSNFTGTIIDLLLDVNQELFTLHKSKTMRLSIGGPSGAVTSRDSVAVAPFYFDLTKYVKKMRYEDANNLSADKSLYCLFQVVYADGSSNDSTDSVCEYNAVHHTYYTDV